LNENGGLLRGETGAGPLVEGQGEAVAMSEAETVRFESLVGEKLDEFEIRWREFILNLQPAS
jgi:hypothetical protein